MWHCYKHCSAFLSIRGFYATPTTLATSFPFLTAVSMRHALCWWIYGWPLWESSYIGWFPTSSHLKLALNHDNYRRVSSWVVRHIGSNSRVSNRFWVLITMTEWCISNFPHVWSVCSRTWWNVARRKPDHILPQSRQQSAPTPGFSQWYCPPEWDGKCPWWVKRPQSLHS